MLSLREGEESRGADALAHGSDQGPDAGGGSDGERRARSDSGSDGPGRVRDAPVRVEEQEGSTEDGGRRSYGDRRRGERSAGELEGL